MNFFLIMINHFWIGWFKFLNTNYLTYDNQCYDNNVTIKTKGGSFDLLLIKKSILKRNCFDFVKFASSPPSRNAPILTIKPDSVRHYYRRKIFEIDFSSRITFPQRQKRVENRISYSVHRLYREWEYALYPGSLIDIFEGPH